MKGNIITLTGEDIILDKNNPTALVYAEGVGWVELGYIPNNNVLIFNKEPKE